MPTWGSSYRNELYSSPVYGDGSMGSFTFKLPPMGMLVIEPSRRYLTHTDVKVIPEHHEVSLPQSFYGMVIPLLYGDLEVAGNIIHVSPEFYKRSDGKWAISILICFGAALVPENPRALRWLKANGLVVYDASPGVAYVQPGLNVVFLRGGAGQGVLSSVFGADTPAYRDRICVLLKDLPIEDFGNQIPSFTARIVEDTNQGGTLVVYDRFSAVPNVRPTMDWGANILYTLLGTGELQSYSIATRQQLSAIPLTGGRRRYDFIHENIFDFHKPTGKIITLGKGPDQYSAGRLYPFVMVINPNNAVIEADAVAPLQATNVGYYPNTLAVVQAARGEFLIVTATTNDCEMTVTRYRGADWGTPAWYGTHKGAPSLRTLHREFHAVPGGSPVAVPGGFDGRYSYVYLTGNDAAGTVTRIKLANPEEEWDPATETWIVPGPIVVEKTVVATFGSPVMLMHCDEERGRLWCWLADRRLVMLNATGTVLHTWTTPYVFSHAHDHHRLNNSRLNGGLVIIGSEPYVYITNLETGESETRYVGQAVPPYGYQAFDSYSQKIYYSGAGTSQPAETTIGSAKGEPVPLAGLLTALATRSGYAAGDVVIENITEPVVGAFLKDATTYLDLLRNVAQVFGFDIVESGGKIKFRKPPTDAGFKPAAVIPQEKLAVIEADSGIVVRERWANDRDLPRQIEIQHYDADINFNYSKQYARRPAEPIAVTYASGNQVLTVPIVMSASQAARLAAERLYNLWEGQVSQEWRTGAEFTWLEAGDVVQLQTSSFTWTVHITSASLSTDGFAAGFSSKNFLAEVAADIVSDSGLQPWVAETPGLPASRYIHLDIPLLDAEDDQGGEGIVNYQLTAPRSPAPWQGGRSFVSYSGGEYRVIDEQRTAPATGICSAVLAAPASPWRLDEVNTIRISVLTGDKAAWKSISEEDLWNNVNLAAVGQPGRWELVAFQNAAVEENGTVVLSRLIRGVLGSEPHMGSHVVGDQVVLITDQVRATVYPIATYGGLLPYRAAGLLQPLDDALASIHAITGTAERPRAPVFLTAARSGDDVVLSWTRRARFGGDDWKDGTEEVPLNEEKEAYDVEVLNGSTVVRTFTDVAAATLTYAAADLMADFGGAVPAALTWRVFQKSALVGRGYGTQTTSTL